MSFLSILDSPYTPPFQNSTRSIQAGVLRCLQTAPCGTVALGTSGLEGPGRLRPQVKLGAAPEIDRHTLQLSEACPAVATSLRVMNSHMDIREALLVFHPGV